MTLNDLIEQLTEMAEAGLGDADVRIASQPSWPLEHKIAAAWSPAMEGEGPDADDAVVYIYDGGQIGYLPEAAREGWNI